MSESGCGGPSSCVDADGKESLDKPYRNKEWLYEQYVLKEKTSYEVADECGANNQTILNWLRKFNIEIRPSREMVGEKSQTNSHPKLSDKEWLTGQYWGKHRNAAEIASELGVTKEGVYYWLNKHDIETRPMSEAAPSGEDHYRWDGGHLNYYGPNWLEQREKARKQDNYTCQYCLTHESEFDREHSVHHRKPIKWYKSNYEAPEWWEKGNDLDNLVTLCEPCHKEWEGIPLRPDYRGE